jgi:acyl-CoA synthetase (AMP-forming)/AMP-acid ligase II
MENAGVGELGEICVRSPHLARGYLGDEALTNERFITNPFTGVEGDRIYRTGELGRYLPAGHIEFVARGENQVSIRGFRVDLGEIESVLKSHAHVSNAVVSLPGLIRSPHRSSGCQSGTDSFDRRNTSFLRARLPGCMIPAAFIICDSLPLTPGKIDGDATVDLGKPINQHVRSSTNAHQEAVAEIWGKVSI